jgi:multidrug efflux pump
MPKFFIDRPVFAWVIAFLILLVGLLSLQKLPVAQYPSIAPPSVAVSATYPGASAETLQNTVTTVIEQQMNGIDGLLYMSSNSQSSGQASITLYFQPGTNPDIAQVQVQNKLQLAMPRLPQEVQQQGVKVAKATRNYLMFVTLSSESGNLDEVALGNYITTSLLDPLSRVTGVGSADLFGSEYAMRVWVSPDKLNGYKLTTNDVINAIKAQNVQVSAGELGGLPAVKGQQLNATIRAQSRLSTPEQFGQIMLRVNPDGSRLLLKDVARIELGAQSFVTKAFVDGHPAAAVGIKLTPSANALETSAAVRAKVAELAPYFPAGVKAEVPYDSSKFVRISIEEVLKTLGEAIVLVFLVMYLFLQNLRATLIPTIVVPIALSGTLGAMAAFGFSINVLTMFGMVLAIGLLVDDAIVVIENVERIMSEEGLSPRKATRKAMSQITNALIGITLVLTAVFIPMAFFGGSVGAIYRQFSLSLVASMLFSVILALSLTPALCATMLKPVEAGHHHEKGGFFGWFNRGFAASSKKYQSSVANILTKTGRYLLIYVVLVAAVGFLFVRLPSSFLPDEDQGYAITAVMLPTGATQERTLKVLETAQQFYQKQPEIEHVITVDGFGFSGSGQNVGLIFTPLKDWSERKAQEHHVQSLIGRAFGALSQVRDAIIFPLNPPPIPELGTSTGFDLMLQDRSGQGHEKLMEARNMLLGMAGKDPRLAGVRPQGLEDTPQFQVEIDQAKASALGLSLSDVNNTLSSSFGSAYVNDFVNGTRVQQVIVQAEAPYRMLPQDLGKLYVRNASGTMVPFSSFASAKWSYGSPRLERYNGVPSVEIVGTAAPGHSSGEAMQAMEELVAKLPPGFGIEWTGQSYEERLSGSQAPALFAISIVVVFLCLAALYESWSIPFAVMLVVPLGVLGALLAAHLRGLPNDVFFKVGILTTIGLSTKNAILIIEFAKDLQAQGWGLLEATLEAVHLRLRPILMTSMAFVLGVTPLVISNGAGSASQHAIGTGVMGGMLSATFLAIFFVPVFFVVVRSYFKGSERQRKFAAHEQDDESDVSDRIAPASQGDSHD